MKKLVRSLVLTIAFGASTRAQNPRAEQSSYPTESIDLLTREFLLQQAAGPDAVAFAEAQRREAHFRQHQFIEKVDQFVAKWNRFANEYNRKGGFNIKSVREMSKPFASSRTPKVGRSAIPNAMQPFNILSALGRRARLGACPSDPSRS